MKLKNKPKNSVKKTYKKPSLKTEKVFETAALACGKCIVGNPIFTSNCSLISRLS